MTKRLISTVVAFGAGLSLAACNLDQPEPGCIVQDAEDWQVKYELVPGQVIASGCEEELNLKGELFGVFKFNNPDDPADTKLAIRPEGLASRADRDPTEENPLSANEEEQYRHTAVSTFATKRDAQNLCEAAGFTRSAVVTAGALEPDPENEIEGEAPTNISYKFDSVKVYSAPSAPGTQMGGEMTYTRDGCTARFKFRAIWPSVDCNPNADPDKDPENTCGNGSGLNPDFAAVCDRELKKCVAAKEIPSFK